MAMGTVFFLVIGGVGLAVLLLALLGAELVGLAGANVDGPISLEAVAGFVSAFGFAGAITSELLPDDTPGRGVVAIGVGLFAAVPTAWLAVRLARAARAMPTDATPTRHHLVGSLGVVVTPIPSDGYGEVRVRVGGQPLKLNARADRPLALHTQVFVVEALTETSVIVEETPPLG